MAKRFGLINHYRGIPDNPAFFLRLEKIALGLEMKSRFIPK
jgi:hypothetical protein